MSCKLRQILPNQQLVEQEPPFASSDATSVTTMVDSEQ